VECDVVRITNIKCEIEEKRKEGDGRKDSQRVAEGSGERGGGGGGGAVALGPNPSIAAEGEEEEL
jgi:hypothetical protein